MKPFQSVSSGDREDSPSYSDLASRCKKLERENDELRSKLLEERILRVAAEEKLKSLNDVASKVQEYADRLVTMSSSKSHKSPDWDTVWKPSPADSWNPLLSSSEEKSSPPQKEESLLSTSAPAGFSKMSSSTRSSFAVSSAIPIVPSLRSSAPEFKLLPSASSSSATDFSSANSAPVEFKLLGSSSDTASSISPPNSSPPDWQLNSNPLLYSSNDDQGSCFLLCDVSREVTKESMEKCVQEKFDLSPSEMRLEFGEGGPGAGRVAFVFVNNGESANKLASVKRFRAVVDGVKMRMKVTQVPVDMVDQYR